MAIITRDKLAPLHADDNLSYADIADIMGCSTSAVSSAVIRFKLPRRRRGGRFANICKDELQFLWADQTITVAQIAQRLRCCPATVYLYSRRLGLPRRKRGLKPYAR